MKAFFMNAFSVLDGCRNRCSFACVNKPSESMQHKQNFYITIPLHKHYTFSEAKFSSLHTFSCKKSSNVLV